MSEVAGSSLPERWAGTTIGEAFLVNPRPTIAISDDATVSFVPMPAVEAMTGRMDPSQVRPFREVSRGFTRFVEGDVLFAKITPSMENGKVAVARGLIGGNGCGSTEFHVLRALAGADPHYLMLFLLQNSVREAARLHMTGTAGQLRVPTDYLASVPFPLAPLSEQHRIVAAIEQQFTRLDAAVASLKRAQANLKRYRASVLTAACEGRLVPAEAELARAEGRNYEQTSVLLERIHVERRERWEEAEQAKRRAKGQPSLPGLSLGKYKEPTAPDPAELPALPGGWGWTTVGRLSWRLQYGTSAKADEDPTGVPVLRMGNIRMGVLDFADLKFLPEAHPDVRKTLLEPGDLLFNRTNSTELVGKTAIYEARHPRACFASYLIRASVLPGVEARYIAYYVNSYQGRQYVASVQSQQVGQANVSGTKLANMPVPLPPAAEQHRIVAEVDRRLSGIQVAEAAVNANLKRAERLRQAILKRAFEGRLVPQDPDDEPASSLLDHIRAERESREAAKPKRTPRTRSRRRKQPAEHGAVSESGARSVDVEKVLP